MTLAGGGDNGGENSCGEEEVTVGEVQWGRWTMAVTLYLHTHSEPKQRQVHTHVDTGTHSDDNHMH